MLVFAASSARSHAIIIILLKYMEIVDYTSLGKTGEKLSAVGLGTWKLSSDERGEVEALRSGFKSGINFVDTAEIYGTEGIVGKAIEGHDDIFVATKVSPTHFHYEDVIRACDASLRRLGVKEIDLYQLHWPSSSIPIKETMQAMEKLAKDGKIRYIGVSNFSVRDMREAQHALKDNEIVANQVEYNVLVRDVEKELLDYCRQEHVTVIAYSPLARGRLFDARYSKLLEFLSGMGRRHDKTAAQVALNWLIAKGNVIPIPKASSKRHVAEIAEACGWNMSRQEVDSINAFLFSYRQRPLASVIGPAIRRSHAAAHILTWLGGLRAKK